MKTKFFYGMLLVAGLTAGLTSCSKDDDLLKPEEQQTGAQSFFNLKSGSEWTYKKYENSDAQPNALVFNGETDHVVLQSAIVVNGATYCKLQHSISNAEDAEPYVRYEYQRVDDSGHLISVSQNTGDQDFLGSLNDTSGSIVHSGADASYREAVINAYGTINYKSAPAAAVTVENKNYIVSPYIGVFTPSVEGLEGKTLTYEYAKGIGLVKSVSKELNSAYCYEQRLVSYRLGQ